MKKNTHPSYHNLKIIINQDILLTKSTSTLKELLMDTDYRKHPAWNKDNPQIIKTNKSIHNFNRKFKDSIFRIKEN